MVDRRVANRNYRLGSWRFTFLDRECSQRVLTRSKVIPRTRGQTENISMANDHSGNMTDTMKVQKSKPLLITDSEVLSNAGVS
jgi:hypothetical protein